MTKRPLNHYGAGAFREGQSSKGMPQIVETDIWERSPLEQRIEAATYEILGAFTLLTLFGGASGLVLLYRSVGSRRKGRSPWPRSTRK